MKNTDTNPWYNGEYDDIDFRKEIDRIGNPDVMQIGREIIKW